MSYVPRLKERYKKDVVPALQKKFNYKSNMQVPRLTKICLNQGVGEAVADKNEASDDQRYCTDQELARAVSELPDLYKQVVLLRFYGDQSCADISRSLNVSLGTVTSQLSRAYSLLRKSLRKPTAYEQNPEVEL